MSERRIEDRVLVALRQITRAISLHSRFIQQQYGLTGPQLIALRELLRRKEATGGELARAVSLSQATVTGILDRLERRGLVVRVRSSQDKRRVIVKLTDAGLTILNQAPPPLHARFLEEFRKLQDWEQTQILSSLQRVASMMQAEKLEALFVVDAPEEEPPKSVMHFEGGVGAPSESGDVQDW